jgi:hypothetical protein
MKNSASSANPSRIAITVVAASLDCVPAGSPLCHSIVIHRVIGNQSGPRSIWPVRDSI